jgi:hypothetical protein
MHLQWSESGRDSSLCCVVAKGRNVPIASFGTQQNRPLLDHLVGAGKQRRYRAAFLNHALATS